MAFPEVTTASSTSNIPTSSIGDTVFQMMTYAQGNRQGFERRNYDNNFFDDGFHYRFFSKVANKIVDVSDRATVYSPMRAIPKASRQIRGIANLLVAPDYVPIIYPEKVDDSQTPRMIQQLDPQTQQPTQVPNPAYQMKMKQAEDTAHRAGRWMLKEWDAQEMIEKIAFMVILAAKHSVSWMQVWGDAVSESIKTQVYDFFDIYVVGELTDPEDSPFMIKAVPQLIAQIKANEYFDEDQKKKISPDNKFASSDIKEAYMSTRFNKMGNTDATATLILKEAYIKEYLNDENMAIIGKQDDGDKILKDRDKGDLVMRQVFVAGNVWLRDRYLTIKSYPFVDFRFEPGPIYQVPLIERFIPINKSLDNLVSRAERYSHTMVTGSWSQKVGESMDITNDAGGQVLKYVTTPPIQNNIAPIPQFFFELMNMLGSLIEEQGTSTSTLGKLPTGVKAHSAIESLKESEYANLVIASRRLKGTVKRICEKMLDIADVSYITPKTVYDMENGKPNYFDVIGHSAMKGREKLKVGNPEGVVPLKGDYKCEIEVQQGMAYTQEGRKQSAKELSDFMVTMAQNQLISPDVVKKFVEQLLKIYQFGPTDDIMEALNNPDFGSQVSENQLTQIKTAVLEALQDAGEVGQEASDKRIMETKVGTMEALKDAGLTDGQPQNPKDQAEIAQIEHDIKMAEEEHKLKMAQGEQQMQIKGQEAQIEVGIKKAQVVHTLGIKDEQARQGMTLKEEQTRHGMKQSEAITKATSQSIAKGGSNGSKAKNKN